MGGFTHLDVVPASHAARVKDWGLPRGSPWVVLPDVRLRSATPQTKSIQIIVDLSEKSGLNNISKLKTRATWPVPDSDEARQSARR